MVSNQTDLLCLEVETSDVVDAAVIWLHGLGADGHDFAPIISELNLPNSSKVRFIFPHAPLMPVTINNGYEMPAWFDIYALTLGAKLDLDGIIKSVAAINKLIEKEIARGVVSNRIILAGFSQGATIALCAGLQCSKPLAGIIALSGYLPQAKEMLAQTNAANEQIPIFLAHGIEDPVVPYALGQATLAHLQQAGLPLTWHSYQMPHSVCAEEVRDISQWIQDRFAEN